MKIVEIDKNFAVDTKVERENLVYYNCLEKLFKIYGLMVPEGERDYFVRMPEETAKDVSESVYNLNKHTTGGRVRFKTNSDFIAIHADMHMIGKMPHFALTGSAGFDLYETIDGKQTYIGTFVPPFSIKTGYESIIELQDSREREITINFPLYSTIKSLFIGLNKDAYISESNTYTYEKPVVYYGSSITQGGCVSRPGNAYESVISRRLDCNFINLGFSGSARGEDCIAEYISGLDMSVFVYDYDYNAPTTEDLKNTHEKMFKCIRKAQPDLPIIMVSRPNREPENGERFAVIENTYNNAIAAGDKNVYIIDGRKIMDPIGDNGGTVDGCHPNDLGFYFMAEAIGAVVEKVLKK